MPPQPGLKRDFLREQIQWAEDAKTLVPQAIASGVGLYGFDQAGADGLLKPVSYYLDWSIDRFTGDERNIATLARVYNGKKVE